MYSSPPACGGYVRNHDIHDRRTEQCSPSHRKLYIFYWHHHKTLSNDSNILGSTHHGISRSPTTCVHNGDGDTNGDGDGDTNGDGGGDTNGDDYTNGDNNSDGDDDMNGDDDGDDDSDTNGDDNSNTNSDDDNESDSNGDGDGNSNGDGDKAEGHVMPPATIG